MAVQYTKIPEEVELVQDPAPGSESDDDFSETNYETNSSSEGLGT